MGGKEGRGDAGWAGIAGSSAVKTACIPKKNRKKEKIIGWADVTSFGGGLRIPPPAQCPDSLQALTHLTSRDVDSVSSQRPHKASAHCRAAQQVSFQAPLLRVSTKPSRSELPRKGRLTQQAAGKTV